MGAVVGCPPGDTAVGAAVVGCTGAGVVAGLLAQAPRINSANTLTIDANINAERGRCPFRILIKSISSDILLLPKDLLRCYILRAHTSHGLAKTRKRYHRCHNGVNKSYSQELDKTCLNLHEKSCLSGINGTVSNTHQLHIT
jgi:hypothetical protein